MNKTILFILIFIGLGSKYAQAQVISENSIITFQNEKDLLLVGKQVYTLEDKISILTIEDILKPENQQKFQLSKKDIFNRIPTQSKFWFKLTIKNLSGKEAWIELGSHYLSYIDYFIPQLQQYELAVQTGSLRPQANKAYPSNLFWLPLGASKEVQTVYVSIRAESLIEVPIKVGSILSLSQEKAKIDYLVGGFVGLLLVMFAYNLFLLFATGDKIYIPYLGYVLTAIFSAAHLNNYPILILFFPESSQYLVYKYAFSWLGIPFVFVGYFAIKSLNLKHYSKNFKQVIVFSILIFGVFIPLLNLFELTPLHIQVIFFQIITLLYIVFLLCICYYLWLVKKNENAVFFAIGWTWAILSVLIYLSCVNGILPYHPLYRNAIFFGTGLETLLFSLALADRINRLRKEKAAIQEENFQLIQGQNEVLEKKVSERVFDVSHYQQLLEQTGRMAKIGAWEWDLLTQKVSWSAVTKEIHGVSADYRPQSGLENATTFYKKIGNIDTFEVATKQCASDGTPFDLELELTTAKGKDIWVRVLGNAEFKGGKYVRMYGTFQDIDQIKRAEIEMREVKEKLSSIFNSISEIVWSVRLPDYKMLLMTPSAVDLYGIGFDDFMGDSTYWEKAIHPEDKAIVGIIYGELQTKGTYYQEYRIVSTTGEVKWVSNNGKIIFDESGIPIRIDGLITDISKRKQVEEALAEEHKLLRTIIDNIPINIYVKDLQFRKILANKAEYEYVGAKSEAEVIGKGDSDLFPEETAQQSLKEDKYVIETGQSILGRETLGVQFGDLQGWFLTSKIPLKNQAGQITGLVGISYNFTARKQAEDALMRILEQLQYAQSTLEQQAEEITVLNNQLEIQVEERTRQLIKRNTQLSEYAFFNAHKLRAPIATILGLYQVLDLDISAEEREMIIQKLRESVVLLDLMVRQSQKLLDEVQD